MSARTVVIVQARMGSTRLPGKVLADVFGQPLLWHVVTRARRIAGVDDIMLATTTGEEDQPVRQLAAEWAMTCYTGSRDDVLDRYYRAAQQAQAAVIVRVTADCPLLDPEVAGAVLARFRAGNVDYASNAHPPTFPDGLDVEVMSAHALAHAWTEARRPSEREHVTPYIWNHPERFRLMNVEAARDYSALRWTVDEAADLAFVRAVYERLGPTVGVTFGWRAVLALLDEEPSLAARTAGIARNAGYERSLAQEREATSSMERRA